MMARSEEVDQHSKAAEPDGPLIIATAVEEAPLAQQPVTGSPVVGPPVAEQTAANQTTLEPTREDLLRAAAWHAGRVQYHSVFLGLSLFVLITATLLRVPNDTQVSIPWINFTLPELCFWRVAFGIECAGCGLTRCFISMAHAQPQRAWQFHPAGTFLFAAVLFQLPYRLVQLRRIGLGKPELRLRILPYLGWGLALALLVQWIWRMAT